ncbi:MAG: TetR/AcrR family transcriptional regulator [Alcanivoracaceae bacterium]|nr:TetR/AcrR family transcriptional regulator [Alcanivoracaceae bacterium]
MTRDTNGELSSGPAQGADERTRAVIRQSFIRLAAAHGYRGVKMAEVAAEAGMSRQNLYRYYRNREELYRATLDELFDGFWQQAEPLFQNFDDSLSEQINLMAMVVASQHPDILRLLADPGQSDLSLSLLRRYFARVLGALLRQRGVQPVDRQQMEIVVSMVSGASLAGLRQWIASDMQVAAPEMARIMSHVFNGRLVELVDGSLP